MSIFDILNTNYSLHEEITKIYQLFFHETVEIDSNVRFIKHLPLGTFINSIFRQWPHRCTCLSLDEATIKLGLNQDINNWTENQCFAFIELIINMLAFFHYKEYKENSGQVYTIMNNINIILENCNKYTQNVDGKYYVLEKDASVTAVADLIDDTNTAISVVAYNYISNQGNISEKQKILKIIADDFEARKEKLKADGRYNGLVTDLGFLLNNINIRHNNNEKSNTTLDLKNIEPDELEKYYDMTYRRYLIAVLAYEELDTRKRIEDIKIKTN